MIIAIDARTIGQEEVGPRFARDGGLDPADGFGNGPELQGPHAGGGQEGREHHVVPRRHAHDVVEVGIEALHEPASGPPGAHHHHPRLLRGHRRPQARVLIGGFGAKARQRSQ
jgi:hypothetical protein